MCHCPDVMGRSLARTRRTGIPAGRLRTGASSFLARQLYEHSTTMDVTPIFNQVLVRHEAHPVEPYVFRVEDLDEFVKEAYRIVGHVAPTCLLTTKTDGYSEHTSQNSTMILNPYDRAISLRHTHRDGSSTRQRASLPQTKTPST